MKTLAMRTVCLTAALSLLVFQATGCGQKKEVSPAETAGKIDTKAAETPGVAAPATKPGSALQAASGQAEVIQAPQPSLAPITEERTYFDFERGELDGWEIPMWAADKQDYVAKNIVVTDELASKGKYSIKLDADFKGGLWYAALTEIQQYLDMSQYRVIRVDLYIPADAPEGLKAKIILTVGDNWKFVEMNQSVPLVPGEWATITANIEPGSYDWKRVVPDEDFAKDVRKIAIRIESNNKPKYTGPIYIDNIRVGR